MEGPADITLPQPPLLHVQLNFSSFSHKIAIKRNNINAELFIAQFYTKKVVLVGFVQCFSSKCSAKRSAKRKEKQIVLA